MSGFLNINPDLFLGSQELNRFQKLLSEDGYRKLFLNNSLSFGLFNNNVDDGEWSNFRVEQGTNSGTIKHSEGYAVDLEAKIIFRAANDNIALIDDNNWYWIKIAHQYDSREQGLVSIDASGNLTGSTGEFSLTLRGVPNNPIKISFPDSTLNIAEYEVSEVISENNASLSGDFIAESNVRYSVVGAFTPGISVPTDSKFPFQYNGCLMTLVQESVLNTPPTLTDGEEFLIARVKRNGVAITIQDKRSLNVYRSKDGFLLFYVNESDNPLIGIESVKFDNLQSTRDKNLVYVGFGFRSSNWTIDSSANRLTLIAGNGGKFKSTSDFTDGDFDGWRAYTKDGKYKIIKQSSLSATQINLTLDSLDPDDFTDTAQEIHIVPNAEEIEIIFTPHPADGINLEVKRQIIPINTGVAIIPVLVYKQTSCSYNVKYRYKNFKTYSLETAIPTDTVSGFLVESDFDEDGVQIDTVRQTYTSHATNGFITLTQASNAYANRIESVETGDLFGVEFLELNNASAVVTFQVGQKKQYQIVRTVAILDGGLGTPYTLTVDHYINLRTDLPTDINDGNYFIFQFKGAYTVGAFNIIFTQDYVNPGSPGTVKYTLTTFDYAQSALDNLLVRCVFDGTDWIAYPMSHQKSSSAAPSGAAGGSLAGTYPNPSIAANAIGAAEISAGAVGSSELASGAAVANIGFTPANEGRTLTAGSGLSGGGSLAADRTFDVNVDGTTIEISGDALRIAASAAGSGLSGGGGSVLAVSVDNSTIEINADSLRVKDAGITDVKLAEARVKSVGVQILQTVVNIVDWNMNVSAAGNSTKTVPHGLADHTKILNAVAYIIDDGGTQRDLLMRLNDNVTGNICGSVTSWNSTNISMQVLTGGDFDTTAYDSTGGYVRGKILITYEA